MWARSEGATCGNRWARVLDTSVRAMWSSMLHPSEKSLTQDTLAINIAKQATRSKEQRIVTGGLAMVWIPASLDEAEAFMARRCGFVSNMLHAFEPVGATPPRRCHCITADAAESRR